MKNIAVIVALLTSLILVSCEKKVTYGKEVTGTSTTITEILKSPESFSDKRVVLEGKLGDVCPSGCWFDLEDEKATNTRLRVDIAPANLAIPPKSSGKARISGTVKYDGKTVVIYGDGVEL